MSKRSILDDIDRELKEEARIPRYKLISPENSKRLFYLKMWLFYGGTIGVGVLSITAILLFFWLGDLVEKVMVPIFLFFGGFATMTGGAITTFSKPNWNPTMTMSYKTKIRRDDILGVLQMLLGLAEIGLGVHFLMEGLAKVL